MRILNLPVLYGIDRAYLDGGRLGNGPDFVRSIMLANQRVQLQRGKVAPRAL